MNLKILVIILMLNFLGAYSLSKEAPYNLRNEKFIGGHDPVSYIVDNQAVPGRESIYYEYDGIKFYFTSAAHKEIFIKDPRRFIPEYKGWCAYAMAIDGELVDVDPKKFKVIDGKIYLFYNGFWADTLKKWNTEDDRTQIQNANQHWKNKHGMEQ